MMSFMAGLLRFFVALAIALLVIGGGAVGWFFDALPALPIGGEHAAVAGEVSTAMRALGVAVGAVLGLIVATLTFGVLALLLDIHDRLGQIAEALSAEAPEASAAKSDRPLNYER